MSLDELRSCIAALEDKLTAATKKVGKKKAATMAKTSRTGKEITRLEGVVSRRFSNRLDTLALA